MKNRQQEMQHDVFRETATDPEIPEPQLERFLWGIGFRCPKCFLSYETVIDYQDHYLRRHRERKVTLQKVIGVVGRLIVDLTLILIAVLLLMLLR